MKSIKNSFILIAIVVLSLAPGLALAQSEEVFTLTAERLHSEWEGGLGDAGWRYKSGNDAAWAANDFDDSSWEKLESTRLDPAKLPGEGWNGAAWFRLHVTVDKQLASEIVAIRLVHWGASEIYLDGKLLESFGTVAADSKNTVENGEVERNPRGVPVPFTFGTAGEHIFAVRYSFASIGDLSKGFGAWMANGRFSPGFDINILTARGAIGDSIDNINGFGDYKLFIGILYAFALLHFLLFIFYRLERGNFFYSLFAFSLANGILSNNILNSGRQTAFVSAIFFIVFAFNYAWAFFALQAFLYDAFAPRFSNFFRFSCLLLVVQLVILFAFLRDRITFYTTCVLVIVSLADSLRLVVSAVWQRRDGAWIIAGGVLILAVGISLAIVREFPVFQILQKYAYITDFAFVLGVPVAVSIYLARNFARTNHHLEVRLEQVKELSEKELDQSNRAAALQLEREQEKAQFAIIEAENERRAKELEEARQLQLSMLPKKLPEIPNIEIAAYMKPATEVGGDYYDFHVSTGGTLTVAVGDATGHGLKAGTMVTATKSLFNNLADEADIGVIFKQSSAALKKMNLRGMFMAMAMAKVTDNHLTFSSAGMPSALIYRAEINRVEEIAIKAMPLGSSLAAPYEQYEMTLRAGDCILLMSDGFPEMFNEAGEMLEFAKAKKLLAVTAAKTPQEIIDRFVEVGESWAGQRPPDDDVTFVVLKFKGEVIGEI